MESVHSRPQAQCRQGRRKAGSAATRPGSAVAAASNENQEAPKPEEAVGVEPCPSAWERIIRSRSLSSATTVEPQLPIVVTPLAYSILRKLKCTYDSSRWGVRPPVLLHGPPGSGKSSYIRWLSQLMGMKQPPVCLFLDQQTEAKSLVGAWVCGRRAGKFEWQEGILSRCVREGRWVVIEQLQQLAHDVHALLHQLAATGYLMIHEQQRRLRAHPDFALFATVAAAAAPGKSRPASAAPVHAEQAEASEEALEVALARPPPHLPALLESWVLLHVPAPSEADVQRIACAAFPAVSPVVSRLLTAFQATAAVVKRSLSRPGHPPPRAVRLPQLRDFLKLCRRLERINSSSSSSLFEGFLTDRLRLRIVEEAVAVLLAHVVDRQLRLRAAVAFAAEWAVQEEQVEAVLFLQKPSLRESSAAVHVGPHYSLPKCSREEEPPAAAASSRGGRLDDLLGAEGDAEGAARGPAAAGVSAAEEAVEAAGEAQLTGQQRRLLQQAAGAVSCGEPLLLVGDTGAGKTFIVSWMAAKVGIELVVVNLHQQSEAEDLLGRWVPRHPPQEVESLWRRLLQTAASMLGSPTDGPEGGLVNSKKRKQQKGDSLVEAARHMTAQVRRRGSRLLQHEAYVALLRLALAANAALLQLLRKAGDRLPTAAATEQQQHQQQQRVTAAELLAICKEMAVAGLALLNDPALPDCSAPDPSNFESIVEACGLRDFVPAGGPRPKLADGGGRPGGPPRRRPRCQLHFAFTEGPLVEAVRTGKWLLLDEINLAPPDLLQRLLGLLDDPEQPLLVLEGGRARLVARHPNFRVFACMNPPTLPPPLRLAENRISFEEEEEASINDLQQQQQQEGEGTRQGLQDRGWGGVGKRELPAEVRQRFTELYVDETDGLEDITIIADAHLRPLAADPPSRLVAEVYIHLRCLSESGQLLDGNNKSPCYSLRTLSRALLHATAVLQRGLRPLQLRAALSEGFAALFGSSLDPRSAARVEAVLAKAFRQARQSGRAAAASSGGEVTLEVLGASPGEQSFVAIEGFLIRRGPAAIDLPKLKRSFVLTPRGQVYLQRVARLLSGSRCALLLEGPTSCGKTSLVSFLAAATGHKCVRINNHEHTDMQEYVGSYAPDAAGRLVFTEGPLTLAVRHGWWVLIDELNLAPSEVLEALNRLLDSNRELVLPATGEVLKAHADFQLFGTQNPAGVGLYGGRKPLSKALANRFLQLQLEELGLHDLRLILLSRCKLPASRAEPMLNVFCDLQQRRAKSSIFCGAHGFMTIRDLMRWGRRVGNSPFQNHLQQQQQQQLQQQQGEGEVRECAPTSLEEVALEGWFLVGERLRSEEERAIVKASLEKHCLKSTVAKPKSLSVDYAADPYVAAFRRLLDAKMESCAQLRLAAAKAEAAAAAATAHAESIRERCEPEEAELQAAEAAAAAAAAAAEQARAAAPDLPAFLPFSFNAASLRLLALTLRALAASENLLLVGETGAGKTAVCELVAWTLQPTHPAQQQQQQQQQQQEREQQSFTLEQLLLQRLSPSGLYAYNCHLQMEASELLGCMHPVHQGDLQQQQLEALVKQSALLQLLEEVPQPDQLLPDWRSELQASAGAAAGAAAAAGGGAGAAAAAAAVGRGQRNWEERVELRCNAAHAVLQRFHRLLQSAAEDVLICLRAARDRDHQQQQHQEPLGEEDAVLFSRALRKAVKEALQRLTEETDAELDAALQREKQLQEEVAAMKQQLQQRQEELVRLTGQLQEQQQQLPEEEEAENSGGARILVSKQDGPKQRQQQQQQQRPEDVSGQGRKRQRKGGRNRAVTAEETAATAQERETAQKRRRRAADNLEADAACASSLSRAAAAQQEDEVASAAAAAAAAASSAAAAVTEAQQQVDRLLADCAAVAAEREDLEAKGSVGSALVSRLSKQVGLRAEKWVCACKQTRRLFCWKDGPLVRAMKEGAVFLLDEASLSQDAVLERLNSVLEDERHLLLTEQGAAAQSSAAAAAPVAGEREDAAAAAAAAGMGVVDVVAAAGFRFVATMNPGGDYGKRELSPALRNRLTEVYVPAFSFEAADAALLLLQRLRHTSLRGLALPLAAATARGIQGEGAALQQQLQLQQELLLLVEQQRRQQQEPDLPLTLLAMRLVLVLRWVKKHVKQPLSIRDAICWICFVDRFVAAQLEQQRAADPDAATSAAAPAAAAAAAKWAVQGFIHGGCLLLLDGLGVGAELHVTQDRFECIADEYLLAEAELLADTAARNALQQQQQRQERLVLLRKRLRQQLEEAAAQPTKRPHLAILLVLLTHACRLYTDLGLHAECEHAQQQQEQQQQQREQRGARGPTWEETCCAFGADGFAWVAEAFAGRLRELPAGEVRGRAFYNSLQIGPFSFAAYAAQAPQQQDVVVGGEVRPQTDEELTQVVGSPSVQRSLGRLLRCLLLQQQQDAWGPGGAGSSVGGSGRHAVLLEGPPGAGKTFVVSLLARLCGRRLVRINLSEDTELADLIGSFVPAAGGDAADELETDDPSASSQGAKPAASEEASAASQRPTRTPFVWADGVLTRHLKAGNWILLDELNLAPQQTLEGLNPLLDHRRCIYLPTADSSSSSSSSSRGDASKKGIAVHAPPGFVLFATQNPHASAAPIASAAAPSDGSLLQQQQQELESLFQLLQLPESLTQFSAAVAARRSGRPAVSKAVGGRKGLPQSLLNRFCRIRVDEMLETDMVAIAHKLFTFLQRKQRGLQQQGEQREQHEMEEAVEARQRKVLSACAVRCVRLMGKLCSALPFRGLGDSAYNLRDVTRLIKLLAFKLPCAEPRASVAVALLSRLRSGQDVATAAHLVARCFPETLTAVVKGKQQQQQQHQQIALYALDAFMCPRVTPKAVLAAVKEKASLPVQREHADSLGAALPLDLLQQYSPEGSRLSLGGVSLNGQPAVAAAAASASETGQYGEQQQRRREEAVFHCRLLLHCQRRCVVAVASALKADFPVLLTGERGSGKSSIVHWLAGCWGAEVCEVQLAPSVDTSDLLGFYRQVQPRQRLLQAARQAERLSRLLLQTLQQQQQHGEQLQHQRAALATLKALASDNSVAQQRLLELEEPTAVAATSAATSEKDEAAAAAQQQDLLRGLAGAAASLLTACEDAALLLRALPPAAPGTSAGLLSAEEMKRRCRHARTLLQQGCALGGLAIGAAATDEDAEDRETAVQFEWIDSVLVAAVREGGWLLLRDAHLCSPSVLDRLNALLEDGGSLLLTEGGSPRLVKRHCNFRVILTADATKVHLLSAALRNRCCEVYLQPSGAAACLAEETGEAAAADERPKAAFELARQGMASSAGALLDGGQLLQGLTARLLRALAEQLRRAAGVGKSAQAQTPLDAMLLRWAASLLSADPEGSGPADAAAAAGAMLHVLGAYLEFYLAWSSKASPSAAVRLCPLLLQDGYRLLLAGDTGTGSLPLAAAEAMALHHAAIRVLLQVLFQESVFAEFAAAVGFAHPAQGPREGRPPQQQQQSQRQQEQHQQHQQQHQQEHQQQQSVAADIVAESLGSLKACLGEAMVLTGLQGLQCLAKRVAGDGGAAFAAAASWRCLQGWGGAYAASCVPSATEGGGHSTAAVKRDCAPRREAGQISVDTLFQCFLWQYTAALEDLAVWRLILLHLLAACCCCCSAFPVAAGSAAAETQLLADRRSRGTSSLAWAGDWIILRGAAERLSALQQSRHLQSSSSIGVSFEPVSSEMSLLAGVVRACDFKALGGSASLLAATTCHFLWAAANEADLAHRVEMLRSLQRERMLQLQQPRPSQQAAIDYLGAACEEIERREPDCFLLPPSAAAAIAAPAVGSTPAHGNSIFYAAARLVRLNTISTSVAADKETGLLLVLQLLRLLRERGAAMLIPERLHLLPVCGGGRAEEEGACGVGLHGVACSVCGAEWGDRLCCLLSLLVAQDEDGLSDATLQEAPRTMLRLFEGLDRLTEKAVKAAAAALPSGSAGAPTSDRAAAAAAEMCSYVARGLKAWSALLHYLCRPLCESCCQGPLQAAVQQQDCSNRCKAKDTKHWRQKLPPKEWRGLIGEKQQLTLRFKALAVSLRGFAAASKQTDAREAELQAGEDGSTAASPPSGVDLVTDWMQTSLSRLYSAMLCKLHDEDGSSELVKPLPASQDAASLFFLNEKHEQQQTQTPAGWLGGSYSGGDAPSLPASTFGLHAQSVRCWLLRDILRAAVLGVGVAAKSVDGGITAAESAIEEATDTELLPSKQERAALLRRFATSAPALGRAQDLLRLAAAAPDGPLVRQPSPRLLVPHASALLALLLSSSLLRAQGRKQAAEKLEARVTDVLLPAGSTSNSAADDAERGTLLRSTNRVALTAAAVRAAAAAEGVLQSRYQQWIGSSRLSIVSIGLLQAHLAARAAISLGMQHAADLLLLHLHLQLQQSGASASVDPAAANRKETALEASTPAGLPLALQRAAEDQLVRQQQLWLPLFTSPAAAFSHSLHDTALGHSYSGLAIPVPPALLEATAVLTAAAWQQHHEQQQQQQQQQQQVHQHEADSVVPAGRKKPNSKQAAPLSCSERPSVVSAATIALELLCCMWRTEVDIHCNDALGLQHVLQLQHAQAEGEAAASTESAGRPAAVLTWRAVDCLAEAAGGLRGAASLTTERAAGAALASGWSAASMLPLARGSCAYAARIAAEVQQHATVSSAGSCFLALQRLRKQLQRLDEDSSRGAERLLGKADHTEQPSHQAARAVTDDPAVVVPESLVSCSATWSGGLEGDAAEWASAVGFCALMWSCCPPKLAECLMEKPPLPRQEAGAEASGDEGETADEGRGRRHASTLLILKVLETCWLSLSSLLRGSAMGRAAATSAAQQLRQLVVLPLRTRLAADDSSTAATASASSIVDERRILDAAHSAVASLLLLLLVLDRCAHAAEPRALLLGDSGIYLRGLLLLLLGRWAVLSSAASVAADLKEQSAIAAWRDAVEVEITRCESERAALLLRAAAVDGCDGKQSLAAASGASTSAAAALISEAASHVSMLKQLLKDSQAADLLLQNTARLLPLRCTDIPIDLALRLTRPRLPGSAAQTASAPECAADQETVAADPCKQVFKCLCRKAAVDATPQAALGAWLEELASYADIALSAKSLSSQLPDLGPLLSADGRSKGETFHSLSASALRSAADAAASCSSRLESTYPLLCGAGVSTATAGLLAVAKGFLAVSAAARSVHGCLLFMETDLQRGVTGCLGSAALSLKSVVLPRTLAVPSLPFATPTGEAPFEALSTLQPIQRLQWLLLWLQADSAATAAEAQSFGSCSKRAGQAGPTLAGAPAHSTLFDSARLGLAGLLEQLAQRQLAWRRQQEIAADETASLMQRLEGLVVDRAAEGSTSRKDAEEAAQELFPCTKEWEATANEQQQQQAMLDEAADDEGNTQYTTWCDQGTGEGAEDSELQQQRQRDLQQLEGLTEADLLHVWSRAVETGIAWGGSRISKPVDAEAAGAAYREALASSLCILLRIHNTPRDGRMGAARARPSAVADAAAGVELAAVPTLDVACGPHLQALLLQLSARLVDESPLQQQQEEQQLKQLLFLQEEEAAMTEEAAQQQTQDPASFSGPVDNEDVKLQLHQERLQQQRERARKLRFALLCRKVSVPSSNSARGSSGAATSFYAPGNAGLLQQLCRPVQQLQEAAAAFAGLVQDHPALQGLLLLSQRVASLSLFTTSPADALTALECLLDRAASWQKAMDRHHLSHLLCLHYTDHSSASTVAGADRQQEPQRQDSSEPAAESWTEERGKRDTQVALMAAMEAQERLAAQAAERLLQRFDAAVSAVERQVLLLRRRQLLEWRFLRDFREERMHRQSLHFAPFLWVLLPDDGDTAQPPRAAAAAAAAAVAAAVGSRSRGSPEAAGTALLQLINAAPVAVIDVLMRFLRTSPLGQFEGRLFCMEAASQYRRLLLQTPQQPETKKKSAADCEAAGVTGKATVVAVAMGAVARFAVASGWQRAVQQQLHVGRKEMDREVSSLASLASWNLSSRAAMKESVHKTHVQLAKHVRKFDSCLQQLTAAAVASTEKQLQQRLVAAALALPLRSPLARARQAAANEQDASDHRQDSSSSSPEDAKAATAGAAASLSAMQEFLQLTVEGLDVKRVPGKPSLLADLHAFSSASVSDIALEVQAVCQEFAAAVKEAAAAGARDADAQQQQQQHQQNEQIDADSEVASKRQLTKKPVNSRQQMQRRFANFRSMLRSTLKLPCLVMCGSAPGLLAAAFNDASGLPEAAVPQHPLRHAAGLQQHDVAASAAAAFSIKKLSESFPLMTSSEDGVALGTPIAEQLGQVWSSASQHWYLFLQTLLECQQLPQPHRDVAAHRDTLLGYAAALVLHLLQQRDRCWRAAAEYQELADASTICLASASFQVDVEAVARLRTAAETLQEVLRQARAVLPSEWEAALQNEALSAISMPQHEALRGAGLSLGTLSEHGFYESAAGSGVAPGALDERRLLRHEEGELREAHRSITATLEALRPLLQLLKETPEGRRLASARSEQRSKCPVKRRAFRVRCQWVRGVEAACAATLQASQAGDRIASQLPSHAAAGLRNACNGLSSSCAALSADSEAARTEAEANVTAASQAFALSVAALNKAWEGITTASCSSGKSGCYGDRLLQLREQPCSNDEETDVHQQPVFDGLPMTPLSALFSFEKATAALNAFNEAAPSHISQAMLQQQPAAPAIHLLHRAAGVLLSAFDGIEGTARLALSLVQLILVLLQLGWGSLSNEEEEALAAGARQPQKTKDEWVAGTGLGEGEGLRDASDQIEEEWQFDGLKDEQPDNEQKPPEQPKSQEGDKAVEVSMDFDAEPTAPPPSQQEEGEQQQQQLEEASQVLDDVTGSVDLQQGGKIEDKRWTGEDDHAKEQDDSGGDGKQEKQKEDIQTEGGLRQGGVQMEGTKEDADDEGGGDPRKDEAKQQQQTLGQPGTADCDTGEDGGKLEADESGQEQSAVKQEYQRELQKENMAAGEDAVEETHEEDAEADDGDHDDGEAGDANGAAALDTQQEHQQARGERATEGGGDDLQLEEDVVLDGEGDGGEGEGDDAAMGDEEDAECTSLDDRAEDDAAHAATAEHSVIEETAGEGAGGQEHEEQQQTESQSLEPEQQDEQDKAAAGDPHTATQAEEQSEDKQEPPEEEEELRDELEADDQEAVCQDPSVQGLAAPLAEQDNAEDGKAKTENRKQQPKRGDRQRMAFGVEGEGSLVRREAFEGEAEGDDASGQAAAESGEQQHSRGDAAAANAANGGSFTLDGADCPQDSESFSSGGRVPPSLLPDNPLTSDAAVERWLQRVRLLQQTEGQAEEEAGDLLYADQPDPMDVDGEAAEEASGNYADEGAAAEDQTSGMQRGQLCQKDDAAGTQEAFAEASEAAAAKPTPNAKLADATDKRSSVAVASSTAHVLSTAARPEAVKEAQEKEKLTKELPEANEARRDLGSDGAEGQEVDDEAPERLYNDPSVDIDTERKPAQQRHEDAPQVDSAVGREGQDALEKEEEQIAEMAADFEERLALEDLGKEGFSPERAATLWHLLESRTAASATALSETLRLILQPTANGGWEGGYRSGKKLSLRRVLAFVASSQRDDRLWLRRRRLRGLQYRVLVGIDCSRSMQNLNAAASALEAVVLLAQTFNHLQIGTVSVCTFGGPKPEVCVHPTPQVSAADGQRLVQRCSFREESHKSHEVAISDLLQLAIREMEKDTNTSSSSSNSMILILSDGRFNKELARPWVNAAIARRCIPLLLILDPPQQQRSGVATSSPENLVETATRASGASNPAKPIPAAHSSSIFDLKQVQQQPGGSIEVTPYLQDFPFPYYAVVNDAQQLPSVLADVIRQWVEAAANDW
ncbi:hypothetical protein Efla_001924 [Eimeria flavescens]